MLVDIFLFSFLFVSSAVRHSLVTDRAYISNITDFPKHVETTMLDNETVSRYDSNSRSTAPMQQWEDIDQNYLDTYTKEAQSREGKLKENTLRLKTNWKRDGNMHVYQEKYFCYWDNETRATGSELKCYFDGELTAVEGKGKLNPSEKLNQDMCVDRLKIYAQHRDRKVKPVVAVFYSESKCSVLCQAKGFYPKYLNMTWKMGGKELQEDVLVGKTLPSGNRTFQKEAVLTVVPVEGINRQLTCEVAHVTGVITETITVEGPSVGICCRIAVGEGVGLLLILVLVVVAILCARRKCLGCTSSTSCCNQESPAESREPLQSNADPAPDNNAA